MDNIDAMIENVMQNDVYVPQEFEQAILTAFDSKKNHSYANIIIKIISTISAFIAITAGVVFAKDISNWINNIFNPKTTSKSVIQMAENGYIQDTNMDYVTNNDTGVKISNILMDDYNLSIAFEVETIEKIDNIYHIEIPDLIISDENNNIIFCNYDRKDLYEDFCKKHNIEYSEKNMHNNYTDGGYQTEIIEKTDKSIKFLYKMFSTNYPKSKKLIFDFKEINLAPSFNDMVNNKNNQKLKGNWNIEIELPTDFYNRSAIIYSVKDGSDKANNIILNQAIGSYTEIHLRFEVKGLIESYEPTKEEMDRLLAENILTNPENDIKAVLENEKGELFERGILNREGNDGTRYHPSGDATVDMTIPITKDDYTDSMKLHLTIKGKEITINLSK